MDQLNSDSAFQRVTPVALENYVFPTSGWVKVIKRGIYAHSRPDLKRRTRVRYYPKDATKQIHYAGKFMANHWWWAVLRDGSYLPLSRVSDLNAFRQRVSYYTVNHLFWQRFGNVEDENRAQPLEVFWPYTKTASAGFHDVVTKENSVTKLQPVDLTTSVMPTKVELHRMQAIATAIEQTKEANTVTIGFITDTHVDSWKTPGTARSLRGIQLLSYYANHFGADLLVHGGDVNDGIKPLDWSVADVKRSVAAMKLGQVPFIVAQGNHDDNSGYARDMAGYQLDQVITNQMAQTLRSDQFRQWLKIPTGTQNPNQAVFGTYLIPNSSVVVIVLDGFDMPDVSQADADFGTFRHGYTHYSPQQISWLKQTLTTITADQQIMVFDHITLNGIAPTDWHDLKPRFENNHSQTARKAAQQSWQIYDILTKHQQVHHNIIGFMAGHSHTDDYVLSDGVQFITSTCGLFDRGDGANKRWLGNLNESAFDILQINPRSRQVQRHRFGFAGPHFLATWQY